MKKIIGIILFVCMSLITYSQQNYLYIGEKKYPSTDSWYFSCKSCSDFPFVDITLGVSVAKTPFGGFLQLNISSTGPGGMYLDGTVMIYLENGTVIKCIDKGMKDEVDGKSIAIYVLTMQEIAKLKSSNIEKIRFNNTHHEGFTAENETTSKQTLDGKTKQITSYVETAEEIKKFFK